LNISLQIPEYPYIAKMIKKRRQIPESQKIALRKHYHDNPHLKQAELIQ